jgi:hypothetical protein
MTKEDVQDALSFTKDRIKRLEQWISENDGEWHGGWEDSLKNYRIIEHVLEEVLDA